MRCIELQKQKQKIKDLGMKSMNNLIYTLEINYANNSGVETSINVKFHDNGLEVKSIRVGDVCVTEETINGRVLSGRFENSDGFCGYRFDLQHGENLLNINPQIPINTAISLINKKKMDADFLSAKMVLSSILRGDYRVLALNDGELNIIRTVSSEDKKGERCGLHESVRLRKLKDEEMFVEQDKKRSCKKGDVCVADRLQSLTDGDAKSQLNNLSYILSQNPQNYKELINIKNQIQKSINAKLTNELKVCEQR